MSITPVPSSSDGFEVVVGSDGTLSVPAEELARHGVRPGTHLRIVPEQRGRKRKSMRGAYTHMVRPEDVDEMVRALDESKAERSVEVERQLHP